MNPPRWRTVLFDFDGTLADTIGLIMASFRHTIEAMGEPALSENELKSWIGRPLRDPFEERWPGRGDDFVATYREWNLAHHDELIVAVPGITELLADLVAAQAQIGVVTSKRRDTAQLGLRAVGLDESVTILAGLGDTAHHKPAPDPLLYAASQLGVKADDCCYVGDAVVDVQAASAAAMASVAVTWGAGEVAALRQAQPTALVETVEQLRSMLLR